VIARVLAPAEYPTLAGTELATVWPYLPDAAQVLVIEEAGQIIGCWACYPLTHVEGVWVAPAHRGKSAVARRLLAGMRRVARSQGARVVNTGAMTSEVADMLLKLGAVELPGRHFALGLGGGD
jgi:hypothetical protein